MALHLILARAAALHSDGHFDDQLDDLPAHPDDTDWASPLDYLFQDHDVLVLCESKTIDDAVNLDPDDWFTPFEPPPRPQPPPRIPTDSGAATAAGVSTGLVPTLANHHAVSLVST
ncbi:hypothetical protein GCM10023094_34830 [Rhodococcus olei]|uniref:Uncharacterized protein n=1 Tax=Rhodococcus olei TaxID=2161675 RepID=A0ABP8P814_9NOCA